MKAIVLVALAGIALAAGGVAVNAGPLANSIMVHGHTTSYGQ